MTSPINNLHASNAIQSGQEEIYTSAGQQSRKYIIRETPQDSATKMRDIFPRHSSSVGKTSEYDTLIKELKSRLSIPGEQANIPIKPAPLPPVVNETSLPQKVRRRVVMRPAQPPPPPPIKNVSGENVSGLPDNSGLAMKLKSALAARSGNMATALTPSREQQFAAQISHIVDAFNLARKEGQPAAGSEAPVSSGDLALNLKAALESRNAQMRSSSTPSRSVIPAQEMQRMESEITNMVDDFNQKRTQTTGRGAHLAAPSTSKNNSFPARIFLSIIHFFRK